MRIGIDARLNAYREGGIAEYTRRLVEMLARLDQDNEYDILHHAKASSALASGPNFRTPRVFTPPHHRLERLAFALEVSRLRLSILHSPDFIPPRFGARHYVITVHDLTFLRYPQFQTPDSVRYYAGNIERAVRQADHILVDAHSVRQELIEVLAVPPDRITVHHLGVDPRYRPLPIEQVTPALRQLGLADETPHQPYILFVGTYEPRKNIGGLLDAYASLRERLRADRLPEVALVIAGRRGWLFETLFEQAETLGLGKSVRWIENVPAEAMPALYNGAAVLVQPSFYEGFGFPPLEAMACGIPTVVATRGSLPEVVGDTGLLIDPDQPDTLVDGLYRALTDPGFRVASREAGIARAATFTWQRAAEVALRVYRQVAGSA